MSRSELARRVGIDTSYLTRIEHGDRDPPRAVIVEALARHLNITKRQRSELFIQAGYCPPGMNDLREWSPALQGALDILTDPIIPKREKDEFEEMVYRLAKKWLDARDADRTS